MKKRLNLTIIILFLSTLVQSHEFWLQPRKFSFSAGEELKVNFMVGENFDGELWDLKKHKIEKLELHHLAKIIDLKNQLKPEAKDKLTFKLTEEGTQLLAMQSNNAYIEMEAEKFNAYLKEDGLDDVYELRQKNNMLNKPSKEFYARYAKLLVQSGNKRDDTFKKHLNFPIEIIPDQNPYSLKSGDYLQCTILFKGKPITNQLVKVWNKIGTTTFLQNVYTEKDGTIKFPLSAKGAWMISTVKMTASEKAGADYQSMWGSLVFGVE